MRMLYQIYGSTEPKQKILESWKLVESLIYISRLYDKNLKDFESSVDQPHPVEYRGVFGRSRRK